MVKAMAIVAKKQNNGFIRYSRLEFDPLPETASTNIRCGCLKELAAGMRRWFSDGRAHFFSPSAFARAPSDLAVSWLSKNRGFREARFFTKGLHQQPRVRSRIDGTW